MNKKIFLDIAKENKPKEHLVKDLILAFLMGGLIAIIYQGISDLLINFASFEEMKANMLSSMILVLIVGILTYFGTYSKLGQLFGAGLFIPLSGFSNSLISCSLEGKEEGYISGIGQKVFSLAGSVIVYGIISSIIIAIVKVMIMGIVG